MTHVSEIVDKLEARDKAVSVQDTDKEADSRRKLAILKAVGLDRAAPEQRELAIAIAKRYDLDLMLKHLVLIDGKPYVTRDALLWIAHRSGQFDGISVTKPEIEGDYWYCEATVWRKDMSHPFVYGGRYPTKGGNQKFAPEMATKVAESMAFRRAFNISAPTQDERWDAEIPNIEPEAPKSLAEKVAEKAAAVAETAPDAVVAAEEVFDGEIVGASPLEQALEAMPPEIGVTKGGVDVVRCAAFPPDGNPLGLTEQCAKAEHETGAHKSREGSWPR